MKSFFGYGLAAGILLAGTSIAHASPMLTYQFYEDGVADYSPSSNSTTSGSIDISTSDQYFSRLVLQVTGVPLEASPDLDTSTTSITTASNFTGTHTIKLLVTQTGLTGPLGILNFDTTIDLNNRTGGGVTSSVQDYFDPSNAAFGMATRIANLNGIAGNDMTNGQTGQAYSVNSGNGPYSETEILTATFTGSGQNLNTNNQISATATPVAVSEPTSLALLGSAMVGLTLLVRRRRSQG